MAGNWKYGDDWAEKPDAVEDERAFDDAPAPEELETEQAGEGEEADTNCEGVSTDDPSEHWEHQSAPVRGPLAWNSRSYAAAILRRLRPFLDS
jgi:hypothetical protein